MGLSGGGKSTSYSGSADPAFKPYAIAGAKTARDIFEQNQPSLNALTSNVTGLVPGLTSMFNTPNAGVTAAQGYNTDVLGGKYMQGNPYLDAVLGKTRSSVMDAVNSNFSMAGRYGSGAHTGVMTSELANAENAARMQDYNTQMGRMDQQAALAPTLSQANYIGLPEVLQTTQAGAELPYTGMNNYAQQIGTLFNGGTQTQKGPSGLGSFLGSAMTAAAMAASDPRLKTNVERIGELDDGLGVYRWTYNEPPFAEMAAWMPEGEHVGVMADEVAKLRPWALGPEIGGYMTVDYSAL